MHAQQTSTYVYGATPYQSPKSQGRGYKYAEEIFNEEEKAKNVVDTCDEPADREKPIEPEKPEEVVDTPAINEAFETSEDGINETAAEDAQEDMTFAASAPEDPFEATEADQSPEPAEMEPAEPEKVETPKKTTRKSSKKAVADAGE